MSMQWLPAFDEYIAPCCADAVRVMAECIDGVMSDAADGKHVAPDVMQEVQDAISCLYHLVGILSARLQRRVDGATGAARHRFFNEEEDAAALAFTARVMLRALQGSSLVREAMASAASVVWAASLAPDVPPAAAAALVAEGLFVSAEAAAQGETIRWLLVPGGCSGGEQHQQPGGQDVGAVERGLRLGWGTGLVAELRAISAVGRVCGLRGFATAMPLEALCARLTLRPAAAAAGGGGPDPRPFCVLIDGLLRSSARMVLEQQDGHFKFHAACVLAAAVRRLLEAWKQQAVGKPSGVAVGDTPPLQPPALSVEDRSLLMEVVWANLEEPLSQTQRQVHETFDALLEILQLQKRLGRSTDDNGSDDDSVDRFLEYVCRRMLDMPLTRKGRYLPLSSLVRAVGALRLLRMQPDLVQQTLTALQVGVTNYQWLVLREAGGLEWNSIYDSDPTLGRARLCFDLLPPPSR